MGLPGPKWIRWLVPIVVVTAVGIGLWYARDRGWLTPTSNRFRGLTSKSDEAAGQGGMAMDMPGMDMGNMSDSGTSVPGYGPVVVSAEVRQRIGVMVGVVEKAPLRMSVRTVGIVRPDETKVARIHLKTEGWAEKLFVNFTGQPVKKGDPLLAIYSPQFLTTQQDYLTAKKAGQTDLADLARQRLELWDVPPEAIEDIGKSGKPTRTLTLVSPITGTVLEKGVLEKEYVTPQKELYVIADLATVWVQAKVYEFELPHVELGMPAAVTLPALPDQKLAGKVVFVQPTVEEKTRTVQVRVELPNKDGLLKPGMFAHVEIEHTMGEGLLVPTTAVIRTGERDIVFRVEAEGRFVPVEVKVSAYKFGDRFQVLDGLKAGDKVVTSANFLIDSESRLRAGGMGMMPGMDMGDMKGMDMKGMDHSKMKGMKEKGDAAPKK
ncbi:MAG: efflux RND transporter periplasmic adaptor subunit [Gemmataceae bacterium]|nr:efflux RND transporter periplasmic adaptor subunit [Gemmataceae bacterium]